MALQTWDQHVFESHLGHGASAKSLLALTDLKFGNRVVRDSSVVTKWTRLSNSRFKHMEETLCEEEERETEGT